MAKATTERTFTDGDFVDHRFMIGDRVEKYTGAYTAFGEVRGIYTTKSGHLRYVVEVEPQGFQMIWSEKELRAASVRLRLFVDPSAAAAASPFAIAKPTCTITINGELITAQVGAVLTYREIVCLAGYGASHPTVTWHDYANRAGGILSIHQSITASEGLRFMCVHTDAA